MKIGLKVIMPKVFSITQGRYILKVQNNVAWEK